MDAPRTAVRLWVDNNFPGARIDSLAGDASTRCFLRIQPARGKSLILMDYGSPFVDETDDIRLTRIFLDADLPVATIRSAVPDPGCLVLEDLGDRMLERELHEPAAAPDLLARAVDLAAMIAVRGSQALADSPRSTGPALDQDRFRFEMDFFIEHYVRNYRGHSPGSALATCLAQLADAAARTPRSVLCHRDFHSRNIMLRADRTLAMVDIQDARWGPETYDLASLLYDAYVDIEESWRDPLVERFRCALPDPPEKQAFQGRFRVVAVERMIKALGTFGYQIATLGRSRYLDSIPRTVRRLERLVPTLDEVPGLGAALLEDGVLGES